MSYPALDYAMKADRVAVASVRLGGKVSTISARSATAHSLTLRARLGAEGIATIWVSLKPKSIDLKPDQVKEYLDEIGASDEIRSIWAASPEPKKWHEVYTKQSKTFVSVGHAAGDHSWSEPAGLWLEFVPEVDPTSLKAGDDFVIRVLRDGKVYANFPVGLVGPDGNAAGLRSTDVDGRVSFRIGSSGRWLLRGTDLRASTMGFGNWESDFTTLTFEAVAR